MALTQPCEWCKTPFPIRGGKHYCSHACWKAAYKQAHRRVRLPRKLVKPCKKRKVAQVVLGIEIPQLAYDRFLWLRCLIREIQHLEALK